LVFPLVKNSFASDDDVVGAIAVEFCCALAIGRVLASTAASIPESAHTWLYMNSCDDYYMMFKAFPLSTRFGFPMDSFQ
jgi:hypothetical protein